MFPPAPGRFSTTTCCPHALVSSWPMTRATRSVVPPAGNGTITLIGFDGYGSAARAAALASRSIAATAALRDFSVFNLGPRLFRGSAGPKTTRRRSATVNTRSVQCLGIAGRASGARTPAQEVALDSIDAEVDAEHHRRGEQQPGEHAGGVEDALRLRDEITDSAGGAHVLADHRPDEREPDRGVKRGEDPRHRGRQVNVAEQLAIGGLQHAR